jgi:hypothetical protein
VLPSIITPGTGIYAAMPRSVYPNPKALFLSEADADVKVRELPQLGKKEISLV